MRHKIALTILLVFLISYPALAAMPHAPAYCDHQGYTYLSQNQTCSFGNGQSCDAWAFYNGSCGEQFQTEIPCREEGEFVFTEFESCCGNLEPHLTARTGGQERCRPDSGGVGGIISTISSWLGSLLG
ncbi:MAG: DUF333 domain-containing protein [Candidatus Nanohaloarchaeota archaeon QJJ-7]|nr:DUF333 domain-containing protein [Candidatus Nanohaloarchaeota archaeon QJJ-7]